MNAMNKPDQAEFLSRTVPALSPAGLTLKGAYASTQNWKFSGRPGF
jgi:hypothetical protein